MTEIELLTQINQSMTDLLLYQIAFVDGISFVAGLICAGIAGVGFKS